MMPSASGSLDSGGIDVEAVDSIDGSRLQSGASVGVRSENGRRPGYHRRVRVAALTAKVEELEAEVDALERAVESEERPRQQVIDSYEAIVAARSEAGRTPDAEDAVSAEGTAAAEAAASAETASPAGAAASAETSSPAEAAASAETAGWRPLDAVASGLERLAARLRRSNE